MRAGYVPGSSALSFPIRAGITWEQFLLFFSQLFTFSALSLVRTKKSDIAADHQACMMVRGLNLERGFGYVHVVDIGSELSCQL